MFIVHGPESKQLQVWMHDLVDILWNSKEASNDSGKSTADIHLQMIFSTKNIAVVWNAWEFMVTVLAISFPGYEWDICNISCDNMTFIWVYFIVFC